MPRCSDPCQASVTFRGQGYHAIHTHSLFHLFIYLFVSLRFLVSAFIPSVSLSTLLTRPGCHSQTSCLLTRHLWLLCSEVSMTQRCWIPPVHRSTLYFQWVSLNFLRTFFYWLSFLEFICFCATKTSFIPNTERNTRELLSSKSWEAQRHFRATKRHCSPLWLVVYCGMVLEQYTVAKPTCYHLTA